MSPETQQILTETALRQEIYKLKQENAALKKGGVNAYVRIIGISVYASFVAYIGSHPRWMPVTVGLVIAGVLWCTRAFTRYLNYGE